MTKTLHRAAVVFALALIAAAFVIALAGCDLPGPSEPTAPTTGAVPVPAVTATTVAPMTVGQVRP